MDEVIIPYAFNYRIGNLEMWSCPNNLLRLSLPHTTASIVVHEEDSHYTAAYWHWQENQFSLCFCGDRPFSECVDSSLFWTLAEQGQKTLDGILNDAER